MGCDGGSIPTRVELVKQKEKPEQKDPNELNRIKWSTCSYSKELLQEPIVACELGNLFNKEALIQGLLQKTLILDPNFSHIRSLKDVIEVHLTPNPAYETIPEASRFVCPVTMIEVGGNFKFYALRPCGCVISKRCLDEAPSTVCYKCGAPFDIKDILFLNPPEEKIAELKTALEEKQLQEKKKRKETRQQEKEKKKRKHNHDQDKSEKDEEKEVKDEKSEREEKHTEKKEKRERREKREKEDGDLIKSDHSTDKVKKRKIQPPSSRASSSSSSASHSSIPGSSSNQVKPHQTLIPGFIDAKLVDKQVYSSIFTSSLKKEQAIPENFLCRNVARV